MRNLRNRVSALALAIVVSSGMVTAVSASDGAFTPPTNDQICAALDKAEDGLALVQNAYLKALLQKLIDAAQAKYVCQ